MPLARCNRSSCSRHRGAGPERRLEVVVQRGDVRIEPRNMGHKDTRLLAVACTRLILIEAPSPAYHRGMLRVAKTLVTNKEETSRRFYTTQHPFYCGIDLHARTMYVLYPRPGWGNTGAPQYDRHPRGAAQGDRPLP